MQLIGNPVIPAIKQEIDQAVALNICNYERTSLLTVDVVAVDVNPTVWAAYCEECSAYVSEPDQNGILVQQWADKHQREFDHPPKG